MLRFIFLFCLVNYVSSQFVCPEITDKFQYYADSDCVGYYECHQGSAIHLKCPVGFLFNVDLEQCDLQENVNCGAITETPPVMDCPAITPQLIYYPDPEDCSKFYECYNGLISHLTCEADHLWNPLVNYCDFVENVDCGDRSTHAPKPTTTTTVRPTNIPPSDSPVTNPPDMYCPPDAEEIIFFPDKEDCQCFYECYMGTISHFTCQPGLVWNQEMKYCDYAANVDCVTKNGKKHQRRPRLNKLFKNF